VIFIDINSSAITEPFSKSHGQSFEWQNLTLGNGWKRSAKSYFALRLDDIFNTLLWD
jgi:hypothetical protein